MFRKVGYAVFAVCFFSAVVSRAETQTWNIDASQSSLSIGGLLNGNVPSPQTSGSTATSFSGTITANRTASTIQFSAGCVIDAMAVGSEQPRSDGTPGSASADYGRMADGPFFSTILEAFRGVTLDLSSDPLTITNNTFHSDQFSIDVTGGESAWNYGTGFGTFDFTGKGTANGAGTLSKFEVNGAIETLTLYFNTGPILYGVAQSNDSTISFAGQIVGTRVVPEVSGLWFVGAVVMMAWRRKRTS